MVVNYVCLDGLIDKWFCKLPLNEAGVTVEDSWNIVECGIVSMSFTDLSKGFWVPSWNSGGIDESACISGGNVLSIVILDGSVGSRIFFPLWPISSTEPQQAYLLFQSLFVQFLNKSHGQGWWNSPSANQSEVDFLLLLVINADWFCFTLFTFVFWVFRKTIFKWLFLFTPKFYFWFWQTTSIFIEIVKPIRHRFSLTI